MKRPRPYIPLATRRTVLLRQFSDVRPQQAGFLSSSPMPDGKLIAFLIGRLFGHAKIALDHNPALILREFNKRTGKYTPDANDPAHLIYRVVDDHHRKTNVSGDGALRSDTAERVHRRRLEKNRDRREAVRAGQPKRRNKIAHKKRSVSRFAQKRKSWPVGRKIESRGFR